MICTKDTLFFSLKHKKNVIYLCTWEGKSDKLGPNLMVEVNGIRDVSNLRYQRLPQTGINASVYTGLNVQKLLKSLDGWDGNL